MSTIAVPETLFIGARVRARAKQEACVSQFFLSCFHSTMMVDAALTTLPSPSCMDRLDAAHALLEVGPDDTKEQLETVHEKQDPPVVTRPRSGSIGLDELAALAAEHDAADMNPGATALWSVSSSSDEDSEAMPPPPPRRGRLRSASNPEGMEKWDSLNKGPLNRMQFVLPSAILEEELAEASARAKAHEVSYRSSLPLKKRGRAVEDDYGTSPNSVTSPLMSAAKADDSPEEGSFPEETDVAPEELLRRARSRLLEDLSEGSLKGEKGVLTLPHSLSKYKEVRAVFESMYRFLSKKQPLTFFVWFSGLQSAWTHWHLHSSRKSCDHC
jgi:hypothetical protein